MALNTYPYSPFPASTEQLHKGDNEDLQAQIDAIKDGTDIDSFGDVETALGVVTGDITNLETDKADLEVVAPAFDAEAGTYDVGDQVTYGGKLYEFTSVHGTPGAWDPTEVTEKTVADEIDTLKSGLTDVNSTLTSKVGIAIATDLNGEKSIGVKTFNYAATGTPSNHSGSALCLFPNDSYGMQIAQSSSETEAYIRFFNTDTWSDWDKILKGSDLTNKLNLVINGTPDSAPFAENASGVTLAIKFWGVTLGYLVLRPKNYLGSQSKPVAMELYNASWQLVWLVLRDAT